MRKYHEIYSRPAVMNMVEAEGKVWMALLDRNGICNIDLVKGKGRIQKVFDGESLAGEDLYWNIAKVGCYLVFSPGTAKKIAFYNLKNNSISYLSLSPVNANCKEDQREVKFWNMICHGTDVYLLGYSYPAIVKIDTRTMEIIYITDWVEEVEKHVAEGDVCGYFSDGHVVIGEEVLLPLGCMKAVLRLDFKTDTTQLIKLDISMKGIGGISSANGENVWMVGKGDITNRVVCWNWRTDEIQESILENMEEHTVIPFYAPICTDSKVILMPFSAPDIYEIELKTRKIQKSKILGRKFKDSTYSVISWCRTMAVRLKGDWLSFLTCDDLAWYEYNVKTGETRHNFVSVEENIEIEQYFEVLFLENKEKKKEISEKKIPLQYFINKSTEKVVKKVTMKENNYFLGQKIYDQICASDT